MSSSRQRVLKALAHQEPDRVPLDLGGSVLTGMHVSSVYQLRQALGLDPPGTPVKVIEPYQMLGEIGSDLVEAVGVDVLPAAQPPDPVRLPQDGLEAVDACSTARPCWCPPPSTPKPSRTATS